MRKKKTKGKARCCESCFNLLPHRCWR